MTLDAVVNFGKVQISTGYDASAVSIDLTAGQGAKLPLPSSDGDFNLVWWNSTDYADPSDDPNVEIVRCTARSTDNLTVLRAQESTSASTKNTAGKTYKMILALTKKMITDIGAVGLKFITVTGTIPGTAFTLSAPKVGQSFIVQNNTIFVEGVDYTVSGTALTWLYTLPAPYSSPLQMLCVG